MANSGKSNRYNIRVVDRAIKVLNMLADGKPRTLTELSKEIEINSSTTFRLLATLLNHNYVQQDGASGQYTLGIACLELARAFRSSDEIRQVAIPLLEDLRNSTMETVHLAVLDGIEVIYVEKLEGLHAIGLMSSRVGRRAPAHCTGIGKALLANLDPETLSAQLDGAELASFTDNTINDKDELLKHLQKAREVGFAFDHGEHEKDVRCVAAPIFNQTGEAVAAISVSGPKNRLDPIKTNTNLIEETKETARAISMKLGYDKSKH